MSRATALILIVLALFITACSPSPEEVCNKMKSLASDADITVSDDDLKECVKDEERKKEMKGIMKYGDYANCIMDAKDIKAAVECK